MTRADRIGRAAVLGMGTMGAGIAQTLAAAGIEVVVLEACRERYDAGRSRLEAFTAGGVERGKLSAEDREALLGRIAGTTDPAALAGAEVVVEAVVEDLALKREVLPRVADAVGDEAIVATNTSALPVTELAACVPAPGRFAGLHFFNPAPVMPLVEVVEAVQSAPATLDTLEALARRIGKEPVRTKDRPGFLVNRLLMPYLNQALHDYDDGLAEADDLDAAVELGLGYPMGPLALLDLVGLDTHRHATHAAWEQTRDPHLVPPPLLERLVAAGRLGRKTGHGIREHAS